MEKFQQALQYLLPTGYAWPRDPNSVLMRLLGWAATSFDELEALTQAVTDEWLPHATQTRLAEWEAATGLPDSCFGVAQTTAARKTRVVSRLRGASGYYPDSSPSALHAIENICADLGYPGTVRYNAPFRCGRDRSGRRLGKLDGKLYVTVGASSSSFRVGRSHVGSRLVERPASAVALACYLQKILPARYELNVVFED